MGRTYKRKTLTPIENGYRARALGKPHVNPHRAPHKFQEHHMINPVAHKGVYYWPSFEAARDYAVERSLPTDRIVSYQLGWAIQLRISGPYVGPAAGPDLARELGTGLALGGRAD